MRIHPTFYTCPLLVRQCSCSLPYLSDFKRGWTLGISWIRLSPPSHPVFLFLPSVALLPPNEFVFIAKHLTPENKENDNMYINVLSLAFSYVILEYSKHIKVILKTCSYSGIQHVNRIPKWYMEHARRLQFSHRCYQESDPATSRARTPIVCFHRWPFFDISLRMMRRQISFARSLSPSPLQGNY